LLADIRFSPEARCSRCWHRASFVFTFEESFMTQADVNRAIAAVTGESVEFIAHHGFTFVEAPDREPLVYDWDAEDARELGATFD
jgi:hypothetical protein